ncbi:MAG: HAD-IA family hydrolase, partial [Acetobacteraceae bacterium]|nr:HAD-IA family hydrolase [Acetobacteraceae bacterium]
MLTVRAVHFDLDGVLSNSRASIRRAWRRWADDRGVRWEAVAPHIEGRLAVDTIGAVLPGLTHRRLQEEADRVNACQISDAEDRTPVPGARDLVRSLAGRPWSVVTGAPRELALARLGRCGFPLPAVLVAAEDVPRGKPDPAGYLLACQRLAVQPADCLVVEDS